MLLIPMHTYKGRSWLKELWFLIYSCMQGRLWREVCLTCTRMYMYMYTVQYTYRHCMMRLSSKGQSSRNCCSHVTCTTPHSSRHSSRVTSLEWRRGLTTAIKWVIGHCSTSCCCFAARHCTCMVQHPCRQDSMSPANTCCKTLIRMHELHGWMHPN